VGQLYLRFTVGAFRKLYDLTIEGDVANFGEENIDLLKVDHVFIRRSIVVNGNLRDRAS